MLKMFTLIPSTFLTILLLLLLFPTHIFVYALGECYTPVVNGSAQLAGEQKPCDSHAYISLCCPVGWTCFGNGVCVVTDTSSPDVQDPLGTTIRGGCTDPLWNTESCGNICLDAPTDDSLQDCGGSNWCCGASLADGSCNCQTGDGTFVIPAGAAQTIIGVSGLSSTATVATLPTSSTSSPTTTTSTSSSSQGSSSSTPTTTRNTSSTSGTQRSTALATATAAPADTGDSTGGNGHLKAGLGGGLGALALIFLGFAIFFLFRSFRKRRREQGEVIRPTSRGSDMEEEEGGVGFRGPLTGRSREEGFVKTGGYRMFGEDEEDIRGASGSPGGEERRFTGEGFEHIRPYDGT